MESSGTRNNEEIMNTIYAIPGLGTDRNLYKNIKVPNYELKILDWPPPGKKLTMKDYSLKFLPQIDQTRPIYLLGVSFGGMLCAELAEHLNPAKTILISSCRNRCQFPFLLKILRYVPVHKILPDKIIRLLAKANRKFLGFEKSSEQLFNKMIDGMPKEYFSLCTPYIIEWERRINSVSIIQIHGTWDKLLPFKKIKSGYSVNKGSHSMVLNKATEINIILNKEFNGL